MLEIFVKAMYMVVAKIRGTKYSGRFVNIFMVWFERT